MGLRRSRLPVLVALSLWLGWSAASPAAPRDELLPLVPDDISLCLVVNNLREHTEALNKAPWLAKLKNTTLGKELLQSPELDKLRKLDQDLQLIAKVGWQRVQNDILGDCVVFAFRHSNQGKPQDERGLMLLWARDPDLLGSLIDLINKEQKKNGELLELVEKKHNGAKYFLRREAKQQQFYLQMGSVFAFTTHEPMLLQVIDLHTNKAKAQSPSPLQKSFARLKVDQALVTFWLNPRAFDPLWKSAAEDNPDTTTAKQAFAKYWQAIDAAAVSLTAGDNLDMQLTLQGRPDELPAAAQKFLQSALQTSQLWQKFPADAVVKAAVRLEGESLLHMLEDFMTPAARAKLHEGLGHKKLSAALGLDFVKDVLPNLGPDVGLCLSPPGPGKAVPEMLLALRVQPGTGKRKVDEQIISSIEFLAKLKILDFNFNQAKADQQMTLESTKQGAVEVKYLAQAQFPAGFQPACALKDGHLVLATAPEAIQRFGAAPANVAGAPLLHVSFAPIAKLLRAHKPLLITGAPGQKPAEPGAERMFDGVLEVLSLVDSLTLDQQSVPGQCTWKLGLNMTAK